MTIEMKLLKLINTSRCAQNTTLASDTSIDFPINFSIQSFDESNTYVLERFYTSPGNPIKEILLKLNLPDHRILKDGGEVIMESLVKKKQKGAILELKRRHLKNTIFCTYTPYPAMKIRRISASSAQETRNDQFPIRRIHYNQYAVCTAVHQSKIRI
ncbi:hypothetical protein Tco_1328345 [Tanacetum coccineum]